MHIEFQRFGGISPKLMNRARLQMDLDESQTREVRALIPESFWTMESSGPEQRSPDAFSYEIAIDDIGRSHRATLREMTTPEDMRPLLRWLQDKAEG